MRNGNHRLILNLLVILPLMLGYATTAVAKSSKVEPLDSDGKRTWIIELEEEPLARLSEKFAGSTSKSSTESTSSRSSGKRLDLMSPQAQEYRSFLDDRFEQFFHSTEQAAGERPDIMARYRIVLNGAALRLTEAQAKAVGRLPGVKSLEPNRIHYIETDAGPELIGAATFWNGQDGLPSRRGEGIVIGIVDTGLNWDHSSFADLSPDGYDHTNPFGEQLGLCGDVAVLCNDKLIGVYDFTDEGSMGKGTNFHGSHVASIAAGNPLSVTIEGSLKTIQGVAPRANLISYKICREDDPDTPDEDEEGCSSADIIEGLEQALIDGVDAVNFSVGGGLSNPWTGYARTFLDLRNAGIFAATSTGNGGPAPASATDPAVAPWLMGVAAATHSRVTGALLKDFSGGDSEAPAEMSGQGLEPVTGSANGIGPVEIVWAGDYGNPLCGTGEPELMPACDDHTGATNPFPAGTFNGQIVVCERGDFGRVEKGFNVREGGAGGYILINNEIFGETLVPDNHCLPGIHIGYKKGQELKNWLTSGSGHMATIGPFGLSYDTSVADVLGDFSSQGPNPVVPGILVPEITAPGVAILGAGQENDDLVIVDGTSMSSPHVVGGAALLLSADPSLTPSQIQSIMQTTAATAVTSHSGAPATPFEMGAGRVQLAEAIKAGLVMDVTGAEFLAANPSEGGDPSSLNLPGMVNPSCQESCSFNREMTDRAGGANWTVSAVNFPDGADVTITPASFTISSGGSQALQIDLDLGSETIGQWVFGEIMLSSNGLPDQHLTAAVFSIGGDLPSRWDINAESNGGFQEFTLEDLSALPNATFTAGGLVMPTHYTETLPQDPTDDTPFDSNTGVMVRLFTVPEGTLWFRNRTPSSTSIDLDLFVGRDTDGDGLAEESELLCESISPSDIESCDIFNPVAGNYWVIVQNWDASTAIGGDDATMITAILGPHGDSRLAASGPGITEKNESFPVRVSWDNVNALPGEEWLGAVGIGSSSDHPGNLGVIPVYFNRTAIAPPETFALMDGTNNRLALNGNEVHDRVFIDVPSGASRITVTAGGASEEQNNGLKLDLARLDFADALADPPFATAAGNAQVLVTASGSNGNPPTVTLSGSNVQPGRWYAILTNSNSDPSAIDIQADIEFTGTPIAVHPGLWEPISRPGLGQGYEYNFGGSSRALIWYTYDEAGQPVWYISGNPAVAGNIWTAELLRVTNDGAQQQLSRVGEVSVTLLAENDAMFSFTLYGKSGTERMIPLSALTCPTLDGSKKSQTGIWYRGMDGLGGASIIMNSTTQAQIHYLFDATGLPRWLFAQDLQSPDPAQTEIPMLQFNGYCAVCAPQAVASRTVGVLGREFSAETAGSWTLDYMFESPLAGSVMRPDQIIKLTDTIQCE